jgi:hypothetical protein
MFVICAEKRRKGGVERKGGNEERKGRKEGGFQFTLRTVSVQPSH